MTRQGPASQEVCVSAVPPAGEPSRSSGESALAEPVMLAAFEGEWNGSVAPVYAAESY